MTKSLVEGEDFYLDTMGRMVLTEAFHRRNGFCCGNGCTHCPFEFINVPEPKRSVLRAVAMNRSALLPPDPNAPPSTML